MIITLVAFSFKHLQVTRRLYKCVPTFWQSLVQGPPKDGSTTIRYNVGMDLPMTGETKIQMRVLDVWTLAAVGVELWDRVGTWQRSMRQPKHRH